MGVISPNLKELWKEWELRALVLFSLTLQIILITLGNCRKYINKTWIQMTLWSAYLIADSVATTALGVLIRNVIGNAGHIDANVELTAFWAPFLLLHLGGPDTITAYSLEDNELWSRHLLQLAAQAGSAFYIFFMAWTGSLLSILAIPMILAGLIKYGERTCALLFASNDRLKDLVLSGKRGNYEKCNFPQTDSLPEEYRLVLAYRWAELSKNFFLDAGLNVSDGFFYNKPAEVMSCKDLMEIIEMELGFLYDMLYTKAMVALTPWGIGLRFASFLPTSIVLVLFTLANHGQKYSKVDLPITFLLLIVAIALEVYAILLLLFSDRTIVWLTKHNKSTTLLRAIASLPLPGINRRWSNSMGQYSLLSYVLKEKHVGCRKLILKLLKINEELQKQLYATYIEVPGDLKEWIFKYFKKICLTESRHEFRTSKGRITLKNEGYNLRSGVLDRSTTSVIGRSITLEQSITLWHIATEICYHLDLEYFTKEAESSCSAEIKQDEASMFEDVVLNWKMSKHISAYLMYLVTMSPNMLPPAGLTGKVSLQETYTEAEAFFKSSRAEINTQTTKQERRKSACRMLFDQFAHLEVEQFKRMEIVLGKAASLLGNACQIVLELKGNTLQNNPQVEEQQRKIIWRTINGVWMELLAYTASHCRGNPHAQQLCKGGELLTHVWVLMSHLDLTDFLGKQDVL